MWVAAVESRTKTTLHENNSKSANQTILTRLPASLLAMGRRS